MRNHEESSVAILLCTYNGNQFIDQQLSSYLAQTHKNWSLWVSDDHSDDDTVNKLQQFSAGSSNPVNILKGPKSGVCKNFMSLINNSDIHERFYAFSDQDDVWPIHKLKTAVQWLDSVDDDIPALYCSRTQLIDVKGKFIGNSPRYSKPPSFQNALLQNIASGNSMVFNNKARDLLRRMSNTPMVIHDWALYLAVTGVGGEVFFDHHPTVLYRQHDNNLIGNGMSFMTRLTNYIHAHRRRKVIWNDANIGMMKEIETLMTDENRKTLCAFSSIRDSSIIERLYLLKKSGVYHQQLVGTLTTLSHTIFNRM
ncbi:glycosyltransferase family 2 protein [Pantoea eucrina]|uniref:Glycosyltransferase family 2 protein n=1 Tax=Pantoea eucrina TaxID=472693 RepID=A0ABU5LDE9_9GAMM|nr:glycosyltransferase family 2 protein [Pantoea eucrina]MDZ7277965.1 glycosyltransferase family 2 protein [Pantoea eucrina]